ncbi:FtsK/SpoIIIE domain-containing protein [Sphingomonas sp. dw_22]|uniref:FtsK/SpoIIIE domain-containing protein n=1 Tax=Sphingomonas sp. dw_22 TaxID=2721175 RepID=UPI001BD5637D|nr:FtsK/SpoIIIE domain-containing protein [Sphingomonas sp. dw_22]
MSTQIITDDVSVDVTPVPGAGGLVSGQGNPVVDSDISQLVSAVAVRRLRRALDASLDEPALFAVFDFDGHQTRRILEEIHAAEPAARIAVHPDVNAGPVPAEWLSSEPLTHWRNVAREESDRAIVSAVTTDALNRLGETAATIHRLSPDHLKADIDAWFAATKHFGELTPRHASYVRNAIAGLLRTDIPTNMPLFARFMSDLDDGIGKQAVHKALNHALAVFRIPPEAANFPPPADRGRITSPESWATQLTDLYNRVSDVAYLRDDQGRPLDREMIKGRVQTLYNESELDDDDLATWLALLDDADIEPGEWRASQQDFVKMRWPLIQKVVKARKSVREAPLGAATIAYLDKESAGTLNNVDRDVLDRLEESRGADAAEAELFGRHRARIEKDRKLLRRWEQFVFREVRNHSDLLSGIVHAAFDLITASNDDMEGKVVLIQLSKANELDFWRRHLLEACLTLRDRHRGLAALLPAFVRIDCGICWSRDWADEIDVKSGHQGSEADFKFEAFLVDTTAFDAEGAVDPAKLSHAVKTQMVWSPVPRGIGLNFSDHLHAIAPQGEGSAMLLSGVFSRTAKDSTSGTRSLRLSDRRSIDDIHDNEDGQLFDPNVPQLDEGSGFLAELGRLADRNIVKDVGRDAILQAFEAFRTSYRGAVDAFLTGKGSTDDAVLEQGRLFGELLAALRQHARGDVARRGLWLPIMRIGTAMSRNVPGIIVTPFFPLRMAEIGLRARMARDTLVTMGTSADDAQLRPFMLRAVDDLQRSWFTDYAIGSTADRKVVAMVENSELDDYSYAEPIADRGSSGDEQGAYTRQAADNLMKVLAEHLDLHPHNVANFSVVLYNSDSRDLPSAVAERLARRVDEDARLRCDLVIASDDRRRLRQVYAEQNVAIGRELESSGGADLTKEFLSNLRVGIGDVEKLATSDSDNKPLDVAFLQDVFARNAMNRWRPATAPSGGWPDFDQSTRAAPSRRMVQRAGENRTRILLVSPTRPLALQRYLDLAMEALKTEVEDPTLRDHWEPLREISFDNEENAEIIRRAHDIADWVVTFDGIADRRLFRQNGISVIRSVPIDEARHNLVVSTKAHRRSLTMRIADMVSDITMAVPADEAKLARKLIDRSADLSGQIVLRAANRDQAALELIGLSLSEQLVQSSLPLGTAQLAWFFLDDFKARLGHAAGDPVADLLLVSARDDGGATTVTMTVVESKYVEVAARPDARSKSRLQTETSVDRITKRYKSNDKLNAPVHAAQLADLLVEHGSFDERDNEDDLLRWVEDIRSGTAKIDVEGISLIYVHDDDDAPPNPIVDEGFRQIFHSRPGIATLLEDVRAGQPSKSLPAAQAATEGQHSGDVVEETGAPGTEDAGGSEKTTDQGTADSVKPDEDVVDLAAQVPVVAETEADTPSSSSANQVNGFRPGVAEIVAGRGIPVAEVAGQEWLASTEKQLRGALKGYGMTCETVGSRLTPNSALIRFRGNDEMTTELVQKRRSTLLTSHGLDIVAVRPAKGEVVVMVARDGRVILPTLDLWKRRQLPPTAPYRNTSFVLGEREDTGEILYLNLGEAFAGQPQHGPHTLIAGETGGGKGIFTANLLLDICATNSPTAARVRLVDPKAGIDYGWVEQVPHLDGPIITTPDDAVVALRDLVDEMERRYAEILGPTKLPNIDAYNETVDEQKKLPRIYFFHDELADWMADKSDNQYRDAVSDYVVRLSGKARAAGIHLFLITQRPDKDALPGLIKANMGNKIALKVSNRLNSQIILDEPGAEGLLGHGHMIAKLANQPGGMIYAQAPYLSPVDATQIAQAISKG